MSGLSKAKKIILVTLALATAATAIVGLNFWLDVNRERDWLAAVNGGHTVSRTEIIQARIHDLTPQKGPAFSKEVVERMAKESNSIIDKSAIADKAQADVGNKGSKEIANGIYQTGADQIDETLKARLETFKQAGFPQKTLDALSRYADLASRAASAKNVKTGTDAAPNVQPSPK